MQRETLLRQLETNQLDMDATLEELSVQQETEDQNYEMYSVHYFFFLPASLFFFFFTVLSLSQQIDLLDSFHWFPIIVFFIVKAFFTLPYTHYKFRCIPKFEYYCRCFIVNLPDRLSFLQLPRELGVSQ